MAKSRAPAHWNWRTLSYTTTQANSTACNRSVRSHQSELAPDGNGTPMFFTRHGSRKGRSLAALLSSTAAGESGSPFGSEYFHWICPSCAMMRPPLANKPKGYLLGSYRIATAPEPNSSRLTSLNSTSFDSPANNVGPWPATLG